MQNFEAANNIDPLKNNQEPSQSTSPTSPSGPRKFKSKYTALISILSEVNLPQKEYKKEIGIISRIIKLGFTESQIYGAWNYYKSKGRDFNSYQILLWNKGKLIKDILPLLDIKETLPVQLDAADYRQSKEFVPLPKKRIDSLS